MAQRYATRRRGGALRSATVGVVFAATLLAVVLVAQQILAAHRAAGTVITRVELPPVASGACCARGHAPGALTHRGAERRHAVKVAGP